MSETKRTQTIKEPRKILLVSYIRDLGLTALIVGVVMFLTGYFTFANVQGDAQQTVVKNMQLAKSVTEASVKK